MRRIGLLISLALLLALTGCSSNSLVVKEGVDVRKAAKANAELGLRYMIQGSNEVAMTKLKRALEFDNTYGPAHHYLAELYRRRGRNADAEEHYEQAFSYSEGDTSLLSNNYGAFLCGQGRYKEGERQFSKVLQNPVYPRRDQVYENMGLCMLRKPDLKKAEEYLRKALQINPHLPHSLLAMGKLSFEEKNYMSARAYLQRFQSEDKPTPESLWLGIRVERILGDKDALASYGLALKGRFPDAPETKLYLESLR